MATPQTKAAYRALLRELPRRNNTHLLSVSPTPLHQRLREAFRAQQQHLSPSLASSAAQTAGKYGEPLNDQIQEAMQLAVYARAQRTYAMLLERYNPGISEADQQERVRLTARRVGMDLPVDPGSQAGKR